ncbi:MAG: hypothetical protein D6732_16515 [Methanobacteriota archaeon]|nr:MAG: hypothetical protein D6732_16515 [Euryarchaeota archaeon]
MVSRTRSTEGLSLAETFNSISRLRKGFFLAYRILLVYLAVGLLIKGFQGTLDTGTIILSLLVALVASILYLVSLLFEMYLKSDLIASHVGKDKVRLTWNGISSGNVVFRFVPTNPSMAKVTKGDKRFALKLEGEALEKSLEQTLDILNGQQVGETNA